VDRLISLDLEAGQAVGIKTQRNDEFWTRGRIPGRPIMPGVLMIEMAAQISSVIYHRKFETGGKKFFGFGGVNEVKFRGTVEPGQELLDGGPRQGPEIANGNLRGSGVCRRQDGLRGRGLRHRDRLRDVSLRDGIRFPLGMDAEFWESSPNITLS